MCLCVPQHDVTKRIGALVPSCKSADDVWRLFVETKELKTRWGGPPLRVMRDSTFQKWGVTEQVLAHFEKLLARAVVRSAPWHRFD